MSPASRHNLDLMTPPVVKTIQQRSLIVGLVYGMAGSDFGINGDSHAAALDQGRMGHGDSQNPGRGHALFTADGAAFRAALVRASQTLPLGASS